MKTQLKNKLALGFLALNLVFAGNVAAEEIDLDSKDYLLVTIPAESAESARLIYGVDGNKAEAFPKDGEVIEINAQLEQDGGPVLGNFHFLGYLDGSNNNTLEIGMTNPIGYQIHMKFKSSGEKFEIESQVPIVLEATGATLEVVQGGDLDEVQNAPDEKVFFTAEAQEFYQAGVMDIRFVVQQPETDDDQNPDQGGDDNADNDENQPEAEASGGCSMVSNAAGSALNLLALLPMAGLALAFRRKK